MTTGILWFAASATGCTRAASSSGASTTPDTPRLTKPSTSETWESRSASPMGPRQMIVAPSSLPACSAPARMLCQTTCVVPFGMTAIVNAPAPGDADPAAAGAAVLSPPPHAAAAARRIRASVFFIMSLPPKGGSHVSTSSVLRRSRVPLTTRGFRLQAEEISGSSPENLFAFVNRVFTNRVANQIDDAVVGGGHDADGPVRPDHQARRPEGLQRRVDVRTQLGRGPRRPVRFGHQPRQLAAYVGKLAEPA